MNILKIKNFWKKPEKVTTEQFIKEADSGDILLFKGKKMSAKFTQGVTGSEFDHVAMVLKFEDDDEVYIIDATMQGVDITSWTQLCNFKDELYSKVIWRQLEIERDDKFIEKLETFVK